MDVESCSIVIDDDDDEKIGSFGCFVYIGFKASKKSGRIGKRSFPVYFATIRHPNLIDSRTPFHGIVMEDILDYGQPPAIIKKEVLAVLSECILIVTVG